jgi:hypothetical protein
MWALSWWFYWIFYLIYQFIYRWCKFIVCCTVEGWVVPWQNATERFSCFILTTSDELVDILIQLFVCLCKLRSGSSGWFVELYSQLVLGFVYTSFSNISCYKRVKWVISGYHMVLVHSCVPLLLKLWLTSECILLAAKKCNIYNLFFFEILVAVLRRGSSSDDNM